MILVAGVFAVLLVRLFYLQVVEGEEYRRRSENNRVRMEELPAPRGRIFARDGYPLVDNRPAFDLMIIPKEAAPLDDTLAELERYTGFPAVEMARRIREAKVPRFKPLALRRDIGRDVVAVVEGHRFELPGVYVEISPRRYYLTSSVPHLLGYLGEVDVQDLRDSAGTPAPYRPGDVVGRAGIEKSSENWLRGRSGRRQVEVNARGQVVREILRENAIPGGDLYLTIDMTVQRAAEQGLEGKAGAVVAMNPANGDILAMASSPTFDPNEFISGITPERWRELSNDPDHPLRDKVIQAVYPPASTYKMVTAMAALNEKLVDRNTTFFCPGYLQFGERIFRCWHKGGHGTVNMIRALAVSCDVYFYQVAQRLDVDILATYAQGCGLGQPTGIDLDGEAAGLVPTSAWKKQRFKEPWHRGEMLSVAIGQGYNLTTPLQMVRLMAAVGNGGTLYRPRIIHELVSSDNQRHITPPTEIKGALPVSPAVLSIVKEGVWAVMNNDEGTARNYRIPGVRMWGKTGTAQIVGRKAGAREEDLREDQKPHAWFVAFGERGDRQLAVAVMVEHGEHGSSAAAPLARDVMVAFYGKNGENVMTSAPTPTLTPNGNGADRR